jgi:hypothetical protein
MFDHCLYRAVLLYEFLMVVVALLRTACAYLLADHNVYFQVYFLESSQLEQLSILPHELQVLSAFFFVPPQASELFPFTPATPFL